MRSGGKGSSVEKVRARERRHRADLDEARLAHDAPGARRVTRPRGVRAQPVRRLGEVEGEALREEQEAVEEAARQHDVVVETQQPVVIPRAGAPRAAG